MEMQTNMEQIFKKLGDLKDFFTYGQKLAPILQKIIDFMQDTVPLLENVNKSIVDSTSKMPKAAHQINNVTSATEVATTEILDIVDGVMLDLSEISSQINSFQEKFDKQQSLLVKIAEKYPGDEDVKKLIMNEFDSKYFSDDVKDLSKLVSKINDSMMNITLSLQVQDITTQQLLSVNHLIKSIQEKLSSLLVDLGAKEIAAIDDRFNNNLSFNPEARYEKNHSSQVLVDSLVEENRSAASQKEIDELFSKR
ncbi:MAG: protein phosphatase CheZ [Bacteroidetes bacterium]|nr:protein phosphatase CheZ [Bacteroidota bacterium]